MPKVYSYLRFSTPEQEEGSSILRQEGAAEKYALENGLDLDDSIRFEDKGVSGYRGMNASVGALRDFRRKVEDRIIEAGSWLLIENLDRFSRQGPWDAFPILQELVNADITIVILSKRGRVINKETIKENQYAIIEIIIELIRANEESARKSDFSSRSWELKRQAAATGKPMTGACPAWIELDKKEKKYKLVDSRVSLVREIFERFLAGQGQENITREINARGIEPWGKGEKMGEHWHKSYLNKILRNRAVIGEFTPHRIEYDEHGKQHRIPTNPIDSYYPAVVDDLTFTRVQELLTPTNNAKGRKTGALVNPFSMVAVCPACGAKVVRVSKGSGPKNPYSYLVCSKAKAGGKCPAGYRVARLELLIKSFFSGLSYHLREVPTDAPITRKIEDELRAIRVELERLRQMETNIKDAVLAGLPIRTMGAEAAQIAKDILTCESLDNKLSASLGSLRPRIVNLKLQELSRLADEETLDVPAVNAALRGLFDRLVIDYDNGKVLGIFHHTKDYVLERMFTI